MTYFSVFTKPWRDLSVSELIDVVCKMGYNAIEFPLRDGFQVSPADAEKNLPKFVEQLKNAGIRVDDVASTPEERVFSACAISGIPLKRVMFSAPRRGNFIDHENVYLRQA